MGPIAATTDGRFIEAYVSAQFLNHVISFGKQDDWLGPGLGGGMAYSNNAENIYAFHINRIEPLHVPCSRGSPDPSLRVPGRPLRGHTFMPNPAYLGGTDPDSAERDQSRRSLGACGENQLPAHGESRVRLRAHRDLGRARVTSPSPFTLF